MSLLDQETGFKRQTAPGEQQVGPEVRQAVPDVTFGNLSQPAKFSCFRSDSIFSTPLYHRAAHETTVLISMGEAMRNIALRRAPLLGPMLHQRICVLAALKPNWDGDRGEIVKSRILAEVVETLRRLKWQFGRSFKEPFLVPTFDGFLQMEWHEEKRSLDIEAVNEGWSAIGTSKTALGKNEYSEGEFDRSHFENIVRLYLWVTGSELIWPLT